MLLNYLIFEAQTFNCILKVYEVYDVSFKHFQEQHAKRVYIRLDWVIAYSYFFRFTQLDCAVDFWCFVFKVFLRVCEFNTHTCKMVLAQYGMLEVAKKNLLQLGTWIFTYKYIFGSNIVVTNADTFETVQKVR